MKALLITCEDAQASKIECWIQLMNMHRELLEHEVKTQEIDLESYARWLIDDWVKTKKSKQKL